MRDPRSTMCKMEHSDPVVNMARVASAPPNHIYHLSSIARCRIFNRIHQTHPIHVHLRGIREGTVASRGKSKGFTWVNFQALVGLV